MNVIKFGFIASSLFLASCASLVFAKTEFEKLPEGHYVVDPTHANIVWTVKHLGLSDYVARFAAFDASIDFDPANIENSKVTASIDPTSIQTAYPNADKKDFDDILANDSGWFNAGKYASIDFKSTKITMTSESTAKMDGMLTFVGISKPVTLDVVFNGAMQKHPFNGKPVMGFSASTTIDRTQWGLSKYVPQVSGEVEVSISGEFSKVND
ncbi:polyisoprenoid-binding protein [Alteromonas sp. 5E99-2]|uniref:YceI family protein n=1 Tax=Alteromonas sp. 5E99-2 TaxID=2817683 RepID=UPI001A99A3E0|nr:YceI family protein [Alteromonas sp. 5E99-2]MBO1254444.1 polyisoprenoid-binding protein [Alteromonas sp. 5E99-2]